MAKKKSATKKQVKVVSQEIASPEKKKRPWWFMIVDFIEGFILLWCILWFHAYLTTSQFGGMIDDVRFALVASLALSVIVFIIYVSFIFASMIFWRKPLMGVGSIVAFPILYYISPVVREGFSIFFQFI